MTATTKLEALGLGRPCDIGRIQRTGETTYPTSSSPTAYPRQQDRATVGMDASYRCVLSACKFTGKRRRGPSSSAEGAPRPIMFWPRARNLEPPATRGGWGGAPSPQVLASGPLIEDGGFTSRSLDSPCIGCSGAAPQPSESTHATTSLGWEPHFFFKDTRPGRLRRRPLRLG
jgi:hypothetical protein